MHTSGRLLHRSPELAQRRAAFADTTPRGPSTIYDWTTSLAAPPAQLAAFDREMSGLQDAVAVGNHEVWGDPLPERLGQKTGAGPGGGLPSDLAAGIESLSGISMADVRVHYGSSAPRELGAHAYAQGNDIHVASGQEQHLAHEAWHVVQQKQGRVRADVQMKGIGVATDGGLEREADVMGARALALGRGGASPTTTREVQGGGGAAQLKPERAFVTREEGAKVHKSNRKKKGGAATKVSRGTKHQLAHGEEINVDLALTVGDYAQADYQTADGTKIGYVRQSSVETVGELAQHETWETTGLPVSVLDDIVAEMPESDRVFPNKQKKELKSETRKYLAQVVAKMPRLPAPMDDVEDDVSSEEEAEPEWVGVAKSLQRKNTTRMEKLTRQERRFLAGKVDGMTPRQAYERGFVCEYDRYPRHFKTMLQQGQVLWTYGTDGKLSIGSEVSDCKHALVGGGKDVWGAGQARLLTELDVGKESGEITEQDMADFDFICLKQKEIVSWGDSDPTQVGKLQDEIAVLLEGLGGQERFDEIDRQAATLAMKDTKLTVSLDFESGHYQPQQGWKRCTDGWSAAGFNVVWSSTSMRV